MKKPFTRLTSVACYEGRRSFLINAPVATTLRAPLTKGTVMLSEAKHLWLFACVIDPENDQRFFASLRMTSMRWLAGVRTALTKQDTSLRAQMSRLTALAELHASANSSGSRTAFGESSFSANSRWQASTSLSD